MYYDKLHDLSVLNITHKCTETCCNHHSHPRTLSPSPYQALQPEYFYSKTCRSPGVQLEVSFSLRRWERFLAKAICFPCSEALVSFGILLGGTESPCSTFLTFLPKSKKTVKYQALLNLIST
jgi:hypothetical protein